jgi:hypothetical protein
MPGIPRAIQAIVDCFLLCETQLRIGMGGAYALDYNVIFQVANSLGIPIDRKFLRLLKAFEVTIIDEINRESKNKIEATKKSKRAVF